MAKVIMVQGTMSNAGKSFITAGLCRIFKQDGYRVVPFKAQNMALNSYVTSDGLEMGRAQVVQAEAAGTEPMVEMNPILLKPSSDTGSQVIVNGEILGNYSAEEYFHKRQELIPVVKAALEKLEQQFDIIVIEGAGSPAEINLKENDLANMGIAKLAKAPVLLVGDIDRGGVFASLFGTVKLLEEEEQALIKGIIINKFRGDLELLKPGLEMMENLVDIPVVGVVPMTEVDIEEEDSLADRLNQKEKGAGTDIVVIRLPHLSNFTDFDVLERLEDVSVRYVEAADEVGMPDVVIIPGTKNTMSDLKWMKDNGLADRITELSELDIPVVGICGGFQMLGKRLSDPYGVENKGTMEGLGLLDTKTVFSREKVRTQAKARLSSGIPGWEKMGGMMVEGYEIHMGITRNLGDCVETVRKEEEGHPVIGLGNRKGTVIGTYLHGFFDAPGIAEHFVAQLKERKRAETEPEAQVQPYHDWKQYKEEQYDRLADLVRNSLDMKKIYEILDRGI